MPRIIALLLLSLTTSAYAKELRGKSALPQGSYLFVEHATENNYISIIGSIETVVTQRAETTTTAGVPIRTWVISTRWIDDMDARRSALQSAVASHPQWDSYAKGFEEVPSAYCSFKLKDPDIKVAQGDRKTALSSTSELCTYVVHTKSTGDAKLLQAVKDNTLIDSGVAPIVVRMPGSTRTLFDAQPISEALISLGIDPAASYSERVASAYLGMGWLQYVKELARGSQDELMTPEHRPQLLTALDQTFNRIFTKQEANPPRYRFQALAEPTPVTVVDEVVLTFDPQAQR